MPPIVRGGRLAIVVLAILGWCAPAAAEWSAALPVFSACKPSTPPELPARWRAVGLMMPLLDGEIDVGEFVYDSTLPAMRASVYGLKSGAVDLLITKDDTYLIDGPHDSPRRCISLGRKLRPPEPQWLGRDARCVGEAPLAARPVQGGNVPVSIPRGTGSRRTHACRGAALSSGDRSIRRLSAITR